MRMYMRACESSLPRITRTRYICTLMHIYTHNFESAVYIGSKRVHAFISLSLKATVNIWIIKPPPRFEKLRLADEVDKEKNEAGREELRHWRNSYGTNKGDSNNDECGKLTLRKTGRLPAQKTVEMRYIFTKHEKSDKLRL